MATHPVDPHRQLKQIEVYHFDPSTFAYTAYGTAYESPLEPDVFHIPADSTEVAPPLEPPAGQWPVWAGGSWVLKADNRGKRLYSTETGDEVFNRGGIGDLPADVTEQAPSTPQDKWSGSAWVSPRTPVDVWNGKDWVTDSAALQAMQWAQLRAKRTGLLQASDWTQVADVPLTADQKAAWTAYRKALRDLPTATQDPAKVVWPVPPAAAQG